MKLKTEFLLPVLVCWPVSGLAGQWLLQPDFHYNQRYTDNLRMQIQPRRDNLITTISPALTMGYLAENQELRGSFRWNELIYHGESELNLSEKISNLTHRYSGERFRTDITLQHAIQSVINQQLDIFSPIAVQVQIPRHTSSVAPQFTFNVTERDELSLGFNYTEVTFDRDQNLTNLQFSDFDNKSYSAGWVHALTERLSINSRGEYSLFNSSSESSVQQFVQVLPGIFLPFQGVSSFSQASTTINFLIGAQYKFDELTQISASGGLRNMTNQVQSEFVSPLGAQRTETSRTDTGRMLNLNLERKLEQGSFNLTADQQLNPATAGFQQTTTRFSGGLRYNLHERWSASLSASYQLSDARLIAAGQNQNFSQSVYVFNPGVHWQWTPEINLDLSYRLMQQDFQFLNQTATSNDIQLQFSYQPQINRQVK
ncbi:MAG: hypothetical protein KGZ80_03000 [Methylomonas sp.]|nr:hypothetical protein [Methylomonas sp.]PPD22783.1 MAG: hypothetical protein CTY23_00165 [Methylomonas sp.]PPD26768.1 MAG: hypothetical protein CTY22_04220 [Methylomonas sp.]PPD38603.1 MAG: hypothetical protein CTY21_04220 [Methylomonas sp.]PPD42778.1 MAG: hypothetical protein CTY17_00300 [Methylomonas sp.]